MAPITTTEEFISSLPLSKMFQVFVLDADNLFPKIIPQVVKSVKTLEGTGGPGTIKQINFAEGGPFKYVKHRIDAINKENFTFKYTEFEGDLLTDKIESITHEIKMESTADGKCKATEKATYFIKAGAVVTEEEIKERKEKARCVFDAVEAYLIANP